MNKKKKKVDVNKEHKVKIYDCGYCPRRINPMDEPKGKLVRKDKKPICTVCRIMAGQASDAIKKDKRKYVRHKKRVEKLENAKEAERILKVAIASQKLAGKDTMIKK